MADNFTPKVKELLRARGCRFVRQGKGDHEIWESPVNGRRFMVDQHIKSRHWDPKTGGVVEGILTRNDIWYAQ